MEEVEWCVASEMASQMEQALTYSRKKIIHAVPTFCSGCTGFIASRVAYVLRLMVHCVLFLRGCNCRV